MTDPLDALDDALDDERPTTDGYGSWLAELGAATSEADLFKILASRRPHQKSRLAQEAIRARLVKVLKEKAEELGSELRPAGVADKWLREGKDGTDLQGRSFEVEEVEPWAGVVSGADVLAEASDLIGAYLHAHRTVLDTLALWSAYTHVFDLFGVSPIADLSSPTKRCGKTTGAIVVRYLARRPLMSSNLSPAALFRAVEAWQPTLIVDEADTFATLSDELRGILNAGHTRDTAFTLRAEGDSNEPRLFSTWAPKLVAAIGRLPDTIEDRSIRIPLARKPTAVVKADAFDSEAVRAASEPVRRKLARFTLDNVDTIATAVVERPAGLHDRAWNNWKPLLQIGAVAGPDWLARALEAAARLSGGEDAEEDDGVLALQHVAAFVVPRGRGKTADVLRALVKREDAPWAKKWEAKVAREELRGPAADLARLLRPFGIKPRQLWIVDRNERGYNGDDFRDPIVAPYLKNTLGTLDTLESAPLQGAGSRIPSDPSDFSGGHGEAQREPRPVVVVGDEAYPALLAHALKNAHVTEAEAEERLVLHRILAPYADKNGAGS